MSLLDRVVALFHERPNEWINGLEVAAVGGSYAWRTRVSELRTLCGMTIENRQRVVRDHAIDCPLDQFWDASPDEARCTCGKSRRYTVSEYRFLPPVSAGDDFQLTSPAA